MSDALEDDKGSVSIVSLFVSSDTVRLEVGSSSISPSQMALLFMVKRKKKLKTL